MCKDKLKFSNCGKIIATVILLSFLKYPVFGEQPTMPQTNSGEEEMRLWSDSEVELLIDEISEAAIEAIEQAAGEAARAAVLSMLEREAALLRETKLLQVEAEKMRKRSKQNTINTGLVCFIGGLFIGVGSTMLIVNR